MTVVGGCLAGSLWMMVVLPRVVVGLRFAQRQPTISEFYCGNTFDSLVVSLMRGGEI